MRWVLVSAMLAVACGCASTREQRLEARVSMQEGVIESLRGENERLKQELDELRMKLEHAESKPVQEEMRLETERVALAERLKGTGLTVGIREGRLVVILPNKVFFAPGKATLSASGKETLRKVARIIRTQFPNSVIRVEGHTDNTPIRKSGYPSNLELSNHRAESVWHFLVESCGINPKRIYTAGFGEYRPVADNSTEAGRRRNRRVEIVIIQD